MKKRALAAVLWLYAGWCLGAAVAWTTGLPAALGPILAFAFAGFFAGDPLHVIWPSRAASDARPAADRQPLPAGSES